MSGLLELVLAFLWALFVSAYAMPSIISIAHRKELLDVPDHRKSHDILTPRLGGVAIFAGFVSALLLFGDLTDGVQQLVAGSLVLFFIGVRDDIVPVETYKKLLIQLLAAGIIIIVGGVRITNFYGFLGLYDLDPWLSYTITFITVIGITNAVNFLDGINGLAGFVVTLILVTFGIFFLRNNLTYSFVIFSCLGGILGFIRFNFPRAKIFMGDTGSLVCGFIIAFLGIRFVDMGFVQSPPAVVIAIMILPIADMIRVFTYRILKGRSPFRPDKNHIHHKLIEFGMSPVRVVIVLLLFNILFIAFAMLLSPLGNTILILIFAATLLIINLIFDFAQPRKLHDQKAAG